MIVSAPYDARTVANKLLDLADRSSVGLTQVSLLKLIYFAHGWYLSTRDKPFIAQDFEAWKYGPVVKVVRDQFKEYGKNCIKSRAFRLDILTGELLEVSADMAENDKDFLLNIYRAYHVYDAWQLSKMTHEQGSPWDKVWNSPEPLGRVALRIPNRDIKAHFDGLSRRFPVS